MRRLSQETLADDASASSGTAAAADGGGESQATITILDKSRPSSFVAGVVVPTSVQQDPNVGLVGWDAGRPICDTCQGARRHCAHGAALLTWMKSNSGKDRLCPTKEDAGWRSDLCAVGLDPHTTLLRRPI